MCILYGQGLSAIFREIGVAHIAGFVESIVESEGCVEAVGCLAAFSHLEVVVEQRTIDGVSAVVDDFVSALHGVLTA